MEQIIDERKLWVFLTRLQRSDYYLTLLQIGGTLIGGGAMERKDTYVVAQELSLYLGSVQNFIHKVTVYNSIIFPNVLILMNITNIVHKNLIHSSIQLIIDIYLEG